MTGTLIGAGFAMTPPMSLTVGPNLLKVLGKVVIISIAGTAILFVFILFMALLGDPWLLLHARIVLPCIRGAFVAYCAIAPVGVMVWGRPGRVSRSGRKALPITEWLVQSDRAAGATLKAALRSSASTYSP